MTRRQAVALAGIALSVAGVALALADALALSVLFILPGAMLLGLAAAGTAMRHRRDTFAAPAVAVMLWIATFLGVAFVWFLAIFDPPRD